MQPPPPPSRAHPKCAQSPFQLTAAHIFQLHRDAELQTSGELIRSQIALDAEHARQNIMRRQLAKGTEELRRAEEKRATKAILDQTATATGTRTGEASDAVRVRMIEAELARRAVLQGRGRMLTEQIEADAEKARKARTERERARKIQQEQDRAKKALVQANGEALRSQIALDAEMAKLAISNRGKAAELERSKKHSDTHEGTAPQISSSGAGPSESSPLAPFSYAEIVKQPNTVRSDSQTQTPHAQRQTEKTMTLWEQTKKKRLNLERERTAKADAVANASRRGKRWDEDVEDSARTWRIK